MVTKHSEQQCFGGTNGFYARPSAEIGAYIGGHMKWHAERLGTVE